MSCYWLVSVVLLLAPTVKYVNSNAVILIYLVSGKERRFNVGKGEGEDTVIRLFLLSIFHVSLRFVLQDILYFV